MFERVGSSQVSSEVMSQQHHFFQSHFGSPLLQSRQKLLLGFLCVTAELGTAAPAKAQQVQSVDWATTGEGIQVLGPECDATPDAVQKNQGRLRLDVR